MYLRLLAARWLCGALGAACCALILVTGAVRTEISSAGEHVSPAQDIPTSPGWWEIPNTQLQSVCPPNNFKNSQYPFNDACPHVIEAWGGGAADTVRNRLIIWGGGHSDYSGNEVYELDLNKLKTSRLTDPTLPIATECTEELGGSAPNSRHTYDSLVYIPNHGMMLSFSGSLAPTGCGSRAAWKFDTESLVWMQLKPSGTSPIYNGGIAAAVYDPNQNLVFISTESYGSFASYDYGANAYRILNSHAITDYHETAVIDPRRKLFFLFGGGYAQKIDISGHDRQYTLNTSKANGCSFIRSSSPGVAFDSSQNLIVGWAGGNAVELYNPDSDSCSSVTYANGPGAQQETGTNGRFQYFPSLDIFVLINSFKQNAYTLRLRNAKPQTASSW
jgi:hypothetical protein